MPGADASQYTAFKKYQSAAAKQGVDRLSQPVPQITTAGSMTTFLPSLTLKNTTARARFPVRVGVPTNKPITLLDVAVTTVTGTFNFTSGVYARGGDYTSIRQAIASQYGVSINNVTLTVKPGSIIVEYQINGVPTNEPPPESIAVAIATIIEDDTNDILKLTFNNNDSACTFKVTSNYEDVAPGLYSVGGNTSNSVSGTFDTNGVTLNYKFPGGPQKVIVPNNYNTMTVILAGGGSGGTASRVLNDLTVSPTGIGVRGSPGGLLIFKVNTSDFIGKELSIFIGAGGRGYTYDVAQTGGAVTSNTPSGIRGRESSIAIKDKTIAIVEGGGPNRVKFGTQYDGAEYTYSPDAKSYLYIPTELIKSDLASNGGAWGPGQNPIDGSYLDIDRSNPANPDFWSPADNLNSLPPMYHGVNGPNYGEDGYCTLIFDNNNPYGFYHAPPPASLTPDAITLSYPTRGDYAIRVPTGYKTTTVTMEGAGGGGGYWGRLSNTTGAVGGAGNRLAFTMRTKLLGTDLITFTVGDGGTAGKSYNLNGTTPSFISRIEAGHGGNTILGPLIDDNKVGFNIMAGGGNGAVCNLAYRGANNTAPLCPNSVGETRPNTIYKNKTDNTIINRIDSITVSKAQTSVRDTNGGWSGNVRYGYNGSEGIFKVTFSDFIPYDTTVQLPKLVISGDYKNISAKYFNQAGIDITSTIPQTGDLWLYSQDPEFSNKLTSVATTNIVAQGSAFSSTGPRSIIYFMYDRRYDIISNYLPIQFPQVNTVVVRDITIKAHESQTDDNNPRSYLNYLRLWLEFNIIPVDYFGNVVPDATGYPIDFKFNYEIKTSRGFSEYTDGSGRVYFIGGNRYCRLTLEMSPTSGNVMFLKLITTVNGNRQDTTFISRN